jgi:hypothetical protein
MCAWHLTNRDQFLQLSWPMSPGAVHGQSLSFNLRAHDADSPYGITTAFELDSLGSYNVITMATLQLLSNASLAPVIIRTSNQFLFPINHARRPAHPSYSTSTVCTLFVAPTHSTDWPRELHFVITTSRSNVISGLQPHGSLWLSNLYRHPSSPTQQRHHLGDSHHLSRRRRIAFPTSTTSLTRSRLFPSSQLSSSQHSSVTS